MLHSLPNHEPVATAIVSHLIARGRVPGLAEEVALPAALTDTLAERLGAAGWAWRIAASPVAEGSLEIRKPSGAPAWRGVYQGSDFSFGAPLLREDLALAAALAGERFPPVVPVGCAPAASAGVSRFN